MLSFNNKIAQTDDAELSMTLTYDTRQKSRFKSLTDSGNEVAVILPRGSSLKHGDVLQAEGGEKVVIFAAPEEVSVIESKDQFLLMRICYHLGNRHVPLQIESHRVMYQCDHVLDDMVSRLGITPVKAIQPFEPEAGAYSHH